MVDEHLGGRLPLLPPGELAPDARALYDRLTAGRLGTASPFRSQADDGALIGPFNALLHSPVVGTGFLGFHEAEERVTPLSARLREVVILSVGAAWRCAYELYAHKAVATKMASLPMWLLRLRMASPIRCCLRRNARFNASRSSLPATDASPTTLTRTAKPSSSVMVSLPSSCSQQPMPGRA
jgi:hypothetical protein